MSDTRDSKFVFTVEAELRRLFNTFWRESDIVRFDKLIPNSCRNQGESSVERIDRNELLLQIAELIGQRSTCPRALAVGGVGTVLAREGRILSTGYAGAPSRLPHCTEVGCELDSDGGCIRVSHSELNSIAWAARVGVMTEEASLYCTYAPCLKCAQAIINAGIIAVYYRKPYRDIRGVQLLENSGIIHVWQKAANPNA